MARKGSPAGVSIGPGCAAGGYEPRREGSAADCRGPEELDVLLWTEVGAHRVAVIQSLLVTCRMQGIDPHVYLMDVLQRIGRHPAKDVIDLMPRVWKEKFGDDPLKSDLVRIGNTLH